MSTDSTRDLSSPSLKFRHLPACFVVAVRWALSSAPIYLVVGRLNRVQLPLFLPADPISSFQAPLLPLAQLFGYGVPIGD
jgi:hypothetical protein